MLLGVDSSGSRQGQVKNPSNRMVINLRVLQNAGYFLTEEQLLVRKDPDPWS